MANQDDVRAVSLSSTAGVAGSSERWKLPLLLTARPGNVGVQIDSHRTMNLFSRPRSDKFTAQFHGLSFEDGSLENYSRVVERTAQRARLLQEKLEKLHAREQELVEDETKRKLRRVQREAARQRRMWQMHQAAKRADQRARESVAAVAVQRVVRGALARRVAGAMKQARTAYAAARTLQRSMKMYVCRQQRERERERRAREEEERRERELHSAATVLQRQARKKLQVMENARAQEALTALEEGEEDEEASPSETIEESGDGNLVEPASPVAGASMDDKLKAEALSRGISLDVLFSDDGEDDIHSTERESPSIETSTATPTGFRHVRPRPPPPNGSAVHRPKRRLSVKRVGGGYRTTPLPLNLVDSSAVKAAGDAVIPGKPHAAHGKGASPESHAGASDAFLRANWHSPTIPRATLPPTPTGSRPVIMAGKSDSHGVRAASPVRPAAPTSDVPRTAPEPKSPYAVPQRLAEKK